MLSLDKSKQNVDSELVTMPAAAAARAVTARRQQEERQRLIDEILYDKRSLLGSIATPTATARQLWDKMSFDMCTEIGQIGT